MSQEFYGLEVLEKIIIVVFLEVKLLVENPCMGWKTGYLQKVKSLLIQKLGTISLRYLVYYQRFYCWLGAETFLVCQLKNGGALGPKVAPEWHKIATCNYV